MSAAKIQTGKELGEEILQALREMNAGLGEVIHTPAASARRAVGLSQAQFATLMGVSLRTLQDWEQGRRNPSGAARTLLAVAVRHPQALRDIAL